MGPTDPPAAKHLTNLTYDEFLGVLEELDKNGARGAVLVAHALLENILRRVLLSKMIPISRDEEDRLFGGMGPFSSMGARVATAYALGLITKQVRRDLDTVRKVRNRFAHTGKKIDFDDPEVVDLCGALASEINPANADERRVLFVSVIKALTVHLVGIISPDATP
jgi:DNA-binding MltR family transcriptional regulator